MRKLGVVLLSSVMIWVVTGANAASSPASPDAIEQSGCCSHHQGVCGCLSGRKQCCDGTLSPSCRC